MTVSLASKQLSEEKSCSSQLIGLFRDYSGESSQRLDGGKPQMFQCLIKLHVGSTLQKLPIWNIITEFDKSGLACLKKRFPFLFCYRDSIFMYQVLWKCSPASNLGYAVVRFNVDHCEPSYNIRRPYRRYANTYQHQQYFYVITQWRTLHEYQHAVTAHVILSILRLLPHYLGRNNFHTERRSTTWLSKIT